MFSRNVSWAVAYSVMPIESNRLWNIRLSVDGEPSARVRKRNWRLKAACFSSRWELGPKVPIQGWYNFSPVLGRFPPSRPSIEKRPHEIGSDSDVNRQIFVSMVTAGQFNFCGMFEVYFSSVNLLVSDRCSNNRHNKGFDFSR